MGQDPDRARGFPEYLGDRFGVEPGENPEHDHVGLLRRQLGEQLDRALGGDVLEGELFGVGNGNSVTVPLGVTRPIALPLDSANQMLPSGPVVIPWSGDVDKHDRDAGVHPPTGSGPATRCSCRRTWSGQAA